MSRSHRPPASILAEISLAAAEGDEDRVTALRQEALEQTVDAARNATPLPPADGQQVPLRGIDATAWSRGERLAAVLPSGRPVYERIPTASTSREAGWGLRLTAEARAAGYHDEHA